jgi:hypothetical protein
MFESLVKIKMFGKLTTHNNLKYVMLKIITSIKISLELSAAELFIILLLQIHSVYVIKK